MATPPVRQAQKTGRSWSHRDGTLYEVICPDCSIQQAFPVGIHRCILCSARWQVSVFEIVRPAKVPEKNPNEKGE
jgi:hypothetical protein